MNRRTFTRDEIQVQRAPRFAECHARIQQSLEPLSLAEGYDWEYLDADGLSDYSTVLVRCDFPLSLPFLLAISTSLIGMSWKVLLAREGVGTNKPELLVEVGPGMLMAFPEDDTLRSLVQSANAVLLSEGR